MPNLPRLAGLAGSQAAPLTSARITPVVWHDGVVRIVDQTLLPGRLEYLDLTTVPEVVTAIGRLAVRGAPAIGVCGALGVALAAFASPDAATVRADAEAIAAARPTAVNLRWAVEQVLGELDHGSAAVLAAAQRLREDAIAATERMASAGADLLSELVPARPMTLHTHCNAGGLAAMGNGTALAVIDAVHQRGLLRDVLVDETRPLLQGARLTTFELAGLGIAHRLCVDGAAAFLLARGRSHAVVVGADRIAANGDVANKVGTFTLALGARYAGVPFVVVAPESSVDPDAECGAQIRIEERGDDEITEWDGRPIAPEGTRTLNLAFDVTPADLVTAIVTEQRIVLPPAGEGSACMASAQGS